jgi:putative oxidoreductase
MIKNNPLVKGVLALARCKIHILEHFFAPLALLAIRLYVGHFYWQSGQTKFANLTSARDLFKTEYLPNWEQNHIKHLSGIQISFPVPGVEFATIASTTGELLFSTLLMIGLAGRAAAFGIFMMTLAIEMFVYPGTDEHYYWMLTMAVILAYGPGNISVDYFIRKKLLPASGS